MDHLAAPLVSGPHSKSITRRPMRPIPDGHFHVLTLPGHRRHMSLIACQVFDAILIAGLSAINGIEFTSRA
jgi:hypothetical protein